MLAQLILKIKKKTSLCLANILLFANFSKSDITFYDNVSYILQMKQSEERYTAFWEYVCIAITVHMI